jgi:[acyl-carrier-protein] S-malonyltransferase
MAAIIGLSAEDVEAACGEAADGDVVSAANFNSPEQTVIAGHAGAVERASSACLARGAKRAISLPVSAPFHSPLMRPARERMAELLAATAFSDAAIPVVTNVDAAPVTQAGSLRDSLVRQIDSPVRWVETVRLLAQAGVDHAVEIGPGNVLAGLVRRIERGIRVESWGGGE